MVAMGKVWFLYINDQEEGPFSFLELSRDERLTPETYAWREGMEDWLPIHEIEELKDLVDHEHSKSEEEIHDPDELTPAPDDELVLELNNGRPSPIFWLLIVLIILFYALYEYFWWQ